MTIVYWIRFPEHTDPTTEGYIGVTNDLEKRFEGHKAQALKEQVGVKNEALSGPRAHEAIIEVIFEGLPADCADEEYRLRPKKNIGWNKQYGGCYNRRTAIEKLERRFKQGWLAKHQYEQELALLIEKVNKSY
jgi:hypothetical protein